MWEVAEDGAKAYLLGSIHAGKKNLYPLDSAIENAFSESERLAVELNILEMDVQAIQKQVKALAQLPEDKTLFEILPSDLFFKLDERLYDFRIHLINHNDLAPWYFLWLMTGLSYQDTEYSAEEGIDMYFLKRAEEQGMPIIPLETLDDQLNAFSGFPLEQQVELLEGSMTIGGDGEERLDQIYALWKKGEAEPLEELMFEEMGDPETSEAGKAFEDKLLTERNYKMADGIVSLLEKGGVSFVVAGGLHMLGGEGVVEILQDRGYEVNQVNAGDSDD